MAGRFPFVSTAAERQFSLRPQPPVEPDPVTNATVALSTATAYDPEVEAKQRRDAKWAGVPFLTARNKPQETRRLAQQRSILAPETQFGLRSAPRAASWLSSVDNAALAHDDVDVLTWLGRQATKLLPKFGVPMQAAILGTYAGVKRVTSEGYFDNTAKELSDRPLTKLGGALKAGMLGIKSGVEGAEIAVDELWDAYLNPVGFYERSVQGKPTSSLEDNINQRRQAVRWRNVEADAARPKTSSVFLNDVLAGVESAPLSLAAAGVTLATGNPALGTGILSGVSAGQSYTEARDEGLSQNSALLKASIDGIVEFGTEYLGERAVAKMAPGAGKFSTALRDLIVAEVGGEQVATVLQDFNQFKMVDEAKGKTFSDYLAERPERARSTLTATLATSGAIAGLGGVTRAVDRALGGAAKREDKAKRAELAAQQIDEMAQMAAASKLRERAPEVFRDFMAEIADDGPVEAVYVDPHQLAEVLNQSGIEPELVDQIEAALGEQFGEAVRHGTDLRIPVEDFTTYLAGTPAAAALADHLKLDPNDMTRAEGQEYMQAQAEEVKAEIKQSLEAALGDKEFRLSAEKVEQAIVQQLTAANRFRADVNAANASGMAAFYTTMAARMGMQPEELYARYPVRIQAEGTGELAHGEINAKITELVKDGPIINIGLPFGQGFGDGQNTPEDVIAALKASGRSVIDWKLIKSDTEDTVVARVDRPYTREELSALSSSVKQDAVAQLDREGGGLAGPLSTDWGPFNGDYFLLPDGSRATGAISLYQGPNNGRLEQARDGSGRDQGGSTAPLEGAPTVAGATGPDPALVAVAEAYARQAGIAYARQAEYARVDPERAKRIADAYEAMEHAPNDPVVREAYENLARQTRAQYDALVAAGYKFYFFDESNDPYAGNPWNAMRDLRENRTMAVFATEGGFGSSEAFDPSANPLLADTGLTWPYGPDGEQKRVLVNDLFRAVHDAFGHGLEGAGFRARGEENAWQAHARLFTGSALAALTTETRGQNSWLNFGPYGEQNRTAPVEETHFADQKTGLMPEWTWTEGRVGDFGSEVYNQSDVFFSPLERAVEESKTAKASGQQWLATLSKAAGVKKEELEWTGLPEWLGEREGAFTRDEVLAFVKAGGIQVEEVVLGDGVNDEAIEARVEELQAEAREEFFANGYFEPNYYVEEVEDDNGEPTGRWTVRRGWGGYLDEDTTYDSEEEAQEAADEINSEEEAEAADEYVGNAYYALRERAENEVGGDAKFESYTEDGGEDYRELLLTLPEGVAGNPDEVYFENAHFGNHPVIAHIRFKTRKTLDGHTVMFIEEVQSDWHQKGRDLGYKQKPDPAVIAEAQAKSDAAKQATIDASERASAIGTELIPLIKAKVAEARELMLARFKDDRSGPDYDLWAQTVERTLTGGGVPIDVLNPKGLVRTWQAAINQGGAPYTEADAVRVGRLEDAIGQVDDLERAYYEAEDALDVAKKGTANGNIPDAPFKTSWPALAMKRAIRWAVDNGIDTIAWTTGDQQRERYNLSRAVGKLTVFPQEGDSYRVAMDRSAANILANNGLGERANSSGYDTTLLMTSAQIKDAFGGEIAKTIAERSAAGSADPAAIVGAEQAAAKIEEEINTLNDTIRDKWVSAKVSIFKSLTPGVGEAELERYRESTVRQSYGMSGREMALSAGLTEANDKLDEARMRLREARMRVEAAKNANSFSLEGNDLRVGGEGMLGFYDRNLINITNGIIKKYGGKVAPVAVEGMATSQYADQAAFANIRSQAGYHRRALEANGFRRSLIDPEENDNFEEALASTIHERTLVAENYATWATENSSSDAARAEYQKIAADARAMVEYLSTPLGAETARGHWEAIQQLNQELKALPMDIGDTNPGFTITPELKQAAEQGFALFQQNRGAYSPATDTITLLKNADLSTFLHESGHFYLEMFDRLAADPAAPQDIRDDFDTIIKWFGVKDAATWRGLTLEQKRPHHEKWARGFEAYLFTGKPPSLKLTDLFQRFRSWLVAVYKKAKALGVQPTPEIRGVMDRMLATQDDIAAAEAARSMLPLFKDRESSGVDEVSWREYQRRAQQATEDATDELGARALRDMKWLTNAKSREIARLKRQASGIRKQVIREVTAEVMAEPVYRAQQFLKTGKIDGVDSDGPHKLYTPEIREQYGAEAAALVEELRGMTSTENGVHPQQVADMFGFSSVDHLLVELTSAEPIKDKIAGLVEQRLLEEHGDLTDDTAIEEAADKAIHNEARARFVATELAMLDNAIGKPKLVAQAARSYAAELIARLKVRDLRPSLYENAAARAAKAAMKALGAGKRDVAAAEKRNQLVNTYAAKSAEKAKQEVADALAYFARFNSPNAGKTIDPSYLEQIHGLLERIDLRTGQSLKAIDRRTSLIEWIEKQRELGFDPVIPDDLLEQAGRKSYKDMTVEELRGLRDAIKNIEHLGRLKSKLLTAKRDRDFASAVGKIADSVMVNAYKDVTEPLEKRGWAAKAKAGVFDFLTDHRKLASLAREMDGGRDGGAVWEYFIRPMNEAADREARMRHDASVKLAEIFAPIKSFGAKQYIPEIGMSLSLEGRMAIALNMGNEVNRERVLTGESWDQDQLDAVLATLTAEQWGIVQQVWDFIGGYWPEIAAKQRRVTGLEPERVEAAPLRVPSADAGEIELAGGYYPIKYNSDRSSRAEGHDLAEYAKQAMRGAYTAATTRRGHTKARIESTGMALRYDLGVVTQHVSEVIHDLTHHELLIDVTRLLRTSTVDGAIRQHYGADVRQAFRKTIEAVAAGDVPAKNTFERAIGHLRNGVTIAGLGWNLSTALLQPLGLAQSIVRIGPKWVGKGLLRWGRDAASFQNSVKWITEQSTMMAERSRTMMREINDINNKIDDKSGPLTAVEASFFWLIAKMQLIADVPTWLGQYEKSVAAGEDHDTAVALADQAVLDSQGGGQQKDLADIQRGGPMMKLWTTFYSYFNVAQNLLASSVNETRRVGPKRLPLLAVDFLLLTMVPTTIGVLIKSLLKGEPPDEEDLVKQNVASVFNLWVGARDIAAIVTSDGRQAAPAGLAMGQFANLYKQVDQGEADAALFKAANRSAGILFHYPSGQVERTVLGMDALIEGQSKNPAALLVGPPAKK